MKRLLLISSVLALSACAGQPHYGVLAAKKPYAVPSASAQTTMANDTYAELASLYPAGSTTWAIQQPTPDIYGIQLVSHLRGAGYAVSEYTKNGVAPSGAVPLSYIIDNLAPYYWRVKLLVGTTTFSRAYSEPQTSGSYTSPVGSWVEGGQ